MSDEPEPDRRRGARRLVLATLGGGVLAVGLAIAGGIWLVHDLDRGPSQRTRVVEKYQQRLVDCIHTGGTNDACANTVITQCAEDPYWHGDAQAITTYCDLPTTTGHS